MSNQMVFRILLVITELIVFAGFMWSLTSWFVKADVQPRWENRFMRYAIPALGALCGYMAFVHQLPPLPIYVFGLTLIILSSALFWWTVFTFGKTPPAVAFSGRATAEFKTTGPYKYVRHPFYSAYIVGWVGCICATGALILCISLVIMIPIYLKAAREEENYWAFNDNKDYLQYKALTGMFFPKYFLKKLISY